MGRWTWAGRRRWASVHSDAAASGPAPRGSVHSDAAASDPAPRGPVHSDAAASDPAARARSRSAAPRSLPNGSAGPAPSPNRAPRTGGPAGPGAVREPAHRGRWSSGWVELGYSYESGLQLPSASGRGDSGGCSGHRNEGASARRRTFRGVSAKARRIRVDLKLKVRDSRRVRVPRRAPTRGAFPDSAMCRNTSYRPQVVRGGGAIVPRRRTVLFISTWRSRHSALTRTRLPDGMERR
jgi:hypothetical protein